jgi:hypothetical protein
MWWVYFVFIYETRRMKPVETVLGARGMTENDGSKSN